MFWLSQIGRIGFNGTSETFLHSVGLRLLLTETHWLDLKRNRLPLAVLSRPLACFLAHGGQIGSDVSVSVVGNPRQLVGGGAARHRTQLLLQDVGALGGTRNPHLQATRSDRGGKSFKISKIRISSTLKQP